MTLADPSGFLEESAQRRGMTLAEFLDFDDGFNNETQRKPERDTVGTEQVSG